MADGFGYPYILSRKAVARTTTQFLADCNAKFAEIRALEAKYVKRMTGIRIGDVVLFYHKDRDKFKWFVGEVRGYMVQPALTDALVSLHVGSFFIQGVATLPPKKSVTVPLRMVAAVLRRKGDTFITHDPNKNGEVVDDGEEDFIL